MIKGLACQHCSMQQHTLNTQLNLCVEVPRANQLAPWLPSSPCQQPVSDFAVLTTGVHGGLAAVQAGGRPAGCQVPGSPAPQHAAHPQLAGEGAGTQFPRARPARSQPHADDGHARRERHLPDPYQGLCQEQHERQGTRALLVSGCCVHAARLFKL